MLKEKSLVAKAISMITTQTVSSAQEDVDGAARGVDPARVAVATDQRRDHRGDGGEEGQRQGGVAEASCHSFDQLLGGELRRALGDQGVRLPDEGRRAALLR